MEPPYGVYMASICFWRVATQTVCMTIVFLKSRGSLGVIILVKKGCTWAGENAFRALILRHDPRSRVNHFVAGVVNKCTPPPPLAPPPAQLWSYSCLEYKCSRLYILYHMVYHTLCVCGVAFFMHACGGRNVWRYLQYSYRRHAR